MKESPRGFARLSLVFWLCLCFATLHAAGASGSEALRAEAIDSQTLLLAWDMPGTDNCTFSVSLCQEDTQRCWLAGATVAHAFLLNSLEPGARYSVHINGGNGAEAETPVTMPGEKQSSAEQASPGLGNLGDAKQKSVVGNASSQLLDASSVAVSWTEADSGSHMYTITLCWADASHCRLLGTTNETTFAIDGLTAGVAYTVHIGASGGNSIAYDFIMPVTKDN